MAGGAALAQGRLAEAADYYRRALHLRPHDGPTHNSLGVALAQQGRYDEALPLASAQASPRR
jgi:Flp pilus assembly protein TadD